MCAASVFGCARQKVHRGRGECSHYACRQTENMAQYTCFFLLIVAMCCMLEWNANHKYQWAGCRNRSTIYVCTLYRKCFINCLNMCACGNEMQNKIPDSPDLNLPTSFQLYVHSALHERVRRIRLIYALLVVSMCVGWNTMRSTNPGRQVCVWIARRYLNCTATTYICLDKYVWIIINVDIRSHSSD